MKKWHEQFEGLKALEDGWLDGAAVKIKQEALDITKDIVESFEDQDLMLPVLFPTPDGGVHLVWHFNTGTRITVGIMEEYDDETIFYVNLTRLHVPKPVQEKDRYYLETDSIEEVKREVKRLLAEYQPQHTCPMKESLHTSDTQVIA